MLQNTAIYSQCSKAWLGCWGLHLSSYSISRNRQQPVAASHFFYKSNLIIFPSGSLNIQTASEEIIHKKTKKCIKAFTDVIISETDCCAMVRRNKLQSPYRLYLIWIKSKLLFSPHLRRIVLETAHRVIIQLVRPMSRFNMIWEKS